MKYPIHFCAMAAMVGLLGGANQCGAENSEPCVPELVTLDEALSIPKHTEETRSMLFKVTDMPDYYKHFKEDENFCSVFHHGPYCGAAQFLTIQHVPFSDKAQVAIISHNKKTGDILRMYKSVEKIPNTIATVTNVVTKMELVDAESKVHELKEIPEIVKKENDCHISTSAVAPHGNWFILRNCDGRITWVKVILPELHFKPLPRKPKDLKLLTKWIDRKEKNEENMELGLKDKSPIELDKILDKYEKEVDEKLRELEIDVSTMKRVPVTLPFLPLI